MEPHFKCCCMARYFSRQPVHVAALVIFIVHALCINKHAYTALPEAKGRKNCVTSIEQMKPRAFHSEKNNESEELTISLCNQFNMFYYFHKAVRPN